MNPKRLIALLILVSVAVALPATAAVPWKFEKSLPGKEAEVVLGENLGLTVDGERQRYYVVDSSQSQLVSFDQQGQLLKALNPGNQLQRPVALELAAGGKLWIVERATNQLLYVDLQQQQVRAFDLSYPDGLSIFPEKVILDEKNRLFVLDRSRGYIVQLDDNLKVRASYTGEMGFKGFTDFQITDGGLWALDGLKRTLTQFSESGERVLTVELKGELEFPVAFEVDDAGRFYLLDRHAGSVKVFNQNGGFSYEFLLQGKRQGRLWFPAGLLFDWAGRLCVVNEGNGRIDIYSR